MIEMHIVMYRTFKSLNECIKKEKDGNEGEDIFASQV